MQSRSPGGGHVDDLEVQMTLDEPSRHVRDGEVVLHDQCAKASHASAPAFVAASEAGRPMLGRCTANRAPPQRRIGDLDATAETGDDTADEGQSVSSLPLAGLRRVPEPENFRPILRRDPRSVVVHDDVDDGRIRANG